MALTQQQIAMIGVYGELPNVVTNFFTRRIMRGKIPYITNLTTISFEVLSEYARKAKILQRDAEFPAVKLAGSVIKAVSPEIIKESVPFLATDQLNRQAGQPIYINGKKVDNKKYEQDRRIATIKNSIQTTQEEISASIMLKGSYKSVDTKNEVKFTYPSEKSVAVSEIKDWSIWTAKQANEFSKTGKLQPTEVLVGEKVFNRILSDYNKSSNRVIPATANKVMTEDGQWELSLTVNGFTYVMTPNATDTEGKLIDFSDKMMMYHDLAFLPAFCGLVNVVNKVADLEAIDVLIRETSANEKTGAAETLGESAYCPLIVNPGLIKVFKFTGLDG